MYIHRCDVTVRLRRRSAASWVQRDYGALVLGAPAAGEAARKRGTSRAVLRLSTTDGVLWHGSGKESSGTRWLLCPAFPLLLSSWSLDSTPLPCGPLPQVQQRRLGLLENIDAYVPEERIDTWFDRLLRFGLPLHTVRCKLPHLQTTCAKSRSPLLRVR